jgi:8-oxo-dGTP pyrophosphatase MutT (NUDIX family)
MQELNLFWKGRIPLEKVTWKFHPEKELTLDANLEKKGRRSGKKTIAKFPDTYDGRLLVLDAIEINPKALHLDTAFTTFSRVLTLEKLKLGFKYRCLGVQALIFSPNKEMILIGQRAEDLYCPLYYGGPGGMLEVFDAADQFGIAVMREIEEEVKLEFQSQKSLVAIMKDMYTKVGTCLLIEYIASKRADFVGPVEGNEEWAGRQLRWYDIDELLNFEDSVCLESPVFVKRELMKYHERRKNVIWS